MSQPNQYTRLTAIDRFFSSLETIDDCWLWHKSNRSNGYVDFMENKKRIRAHIWAYLYFVGEYNRAMDLDHICHNDTNCTGGNSCVHRRCVNPAHLEPVTRSENARRGRCGEHMRRKKMELNYV